jgi:hypothetical protein
MLHHRVEICLTLQVEDLNHLQPNTGENSKEAKGKRSESQDLNKMGVGNSVNQPEVSSLRGQKNMNEVPF